eukprot:s24_g6.t1
MSEASKLKLNHVEVGFASTLLGAMVFLMSLTYFTNHSDQDIRRYTYEVISQTIAIFCAVMVFQYINEATDKAMVYFEWDSLPFLVHMTQMIVWYSALQFHLYYISFQGAVALAKHKFAEVEGIHSSQQQVSVWTALQSLWGMEHITFSDLHPLDHIEDLQSQMTCWKVLLSHIAGFAAINAFGTLQQSEPWRKDWQSATIVVILAALTMLLIQWYFDGQRRKVVESWKAAASVYDDRMEEVYNECFVMWLEEAEEPEDNVLALTVSFLSVQAIRFWIAGTLPDVEGLDPWHLETTRSMEDVAALFAAGAIFCVGTFALDIYAGRHLEIENGEQEEPRVVQVAMAACNQAFAWSLYFACKWNLATHVFRDAPEEKMLLQLELATAVSLLAFFAIWVLDKLADLEATGDETDHAIIQVIGGFSILVGFAWEQCFDRAIEVIAFNQEEINHVPPLMSKLLLAAICICIIIPAWRTWILPMVLREGWRFGFVIDGSDKRWSRVFRSKRWFWLMHRYGIETVGFKKPPKAANRNQSHAFQKRRNVKGLFKILTREKYLQIQNRVHAKESGKPTPTLLYNCYGGLGEPLLNTDLVAVHEAMDALNRQLLHLSHETAHPVSRQEMASVSERISKLSTMAAELGLGLSSEANTAKAGGILVV